MNNLTRLLYVGFSLFACVACDNQSAPTSSSMDIINHEQDIQAARCKNGYSDGCEQERAIAAIKKAGQ